MANRNTVVTKGPRGLEDRGSPSSVAGSIKDKVKVPAAVSKRDAFEHTLQSAKSGNITQLTSPHDRFNEISGVRVKAKPLVLNFTEHGGFLKLDLRKIEDRRKWLYVVGTEAWTAEMKKLGIDTALPAEDGTDPIAPHPRFGLGKSFWKLSDMQQETQARKRESLLKQLAEDDELATLVIETPDELIANLKQRRERRAAASASKPAVAPPGAANPEEGAI